MIFPLSGQTKKKKKKRNTGEREGGEGIVSSLSEPKEVFIQCNKNRREKIFWVVGWNVLTLLNIVSRKGWYLTKLKGGEKYCFNEVKMKCLNGSQVLICLSINAFSTNLGSQPKFVDFFSGLYPKSIKKNKKKLIVLSVEK